MNKIGQQFASDDGLDEVLDWIRMESVPEFPKAELDASAEQSPDVTAQPTQSKKQKRPIAGHVKWSLLAAVAATLAFVAFIAWPQSGNTAFAKVQEAMNSVKAVSYTVMDYHPDGSTYQTDVSFVAPHLSRAVAAHSFTQIFDWQENIQLVIDDQKKTATFTELDPTVQFSIRRQQFLTTFHDISEKATRLIGPTTFNGKDAEEFVVRFGDRDFNVLVDSETMLPVQMTYDGTIDGQPGFREIFQDFKFDADVDMSLFDLKAPDGYSVKHVELVEGPEDGESFTVSPTTGLAPLGFGCDEQQIVDFLGKPELRKETVLGGIRATPDSVPDYAADESHKLVTLTYQSHGLVLSLNSEGGLSSIQCLSQLRNGPSVRDFPGQTVEGIRIGDSVEKVIDVYGEPELSHNHVLHYIRKGWSFHEMDQRISGINVERPTPDELEISVNDKDGSWSIRMKSDDE